MKIKFAHIKLSAFTLPEIVVSLLLIAILFATSSTVYVIIYKQGNALLNKNSFYADYFVMKHALQDDFSRPGVITISENKKKLVMQDFHSKEKDFGKVTYLFDSTRIIRIKEDKADTLQPGGIITTSSMLADTVPLVCALKMCSWYKGKSYFIYLRKHYSAEEIFSFNDIISN